MFCVWTVELISKVSLVLSFNDISVKLKTKIRFTDSYLSSTCILWNLTLTNKTNETLKINLTVKTSNSILDSIPWLPTNILEFFFFHSYLFSAVTKHAKLFLCINLNAEIYFLILSFESFFCEIIRGAGNYESIILHVSHMFDREAVMNPPPPYKPLIYKKKLIQSIKPRVINSRGNNPKYIITVFNILVLG